MGATGGKNREPEENRSQIILQKLPEGLMCTQEGGFKPTTLMAQALVAWCLQSVEPAVAEMLNVKEGKDLSPPLVITALGSHRQNWYDWHKRKGFVKWWREGVEKLITDRILPIVQRHHASLSTVTKDPSMLKLFYQRFDEKYIERSSKALTHDFPGFKPPDADIAQIQDRSAKRIESYATAKIDDEPTPLCADTREGGGGADGGLDKIILPVEQNVTQNQVHDNSYPEGIESE